MNNLSCTKTFFNIDNIMSSPKSIFICLWVIFMYLPLSPDPFQEEAIFQNSKCSLSTFLAANSSSNFSFLFDLKIKHFPNSNFICNLSNSWGPNKSRDTLCFFTPSVTDNFLKNNKQTRLRLRESFQEELTPLSFLRVAPGYPWHIASGDGVGRQTSSIIARSVFLWVTLSVIVSRCTYYQSWSFKHRFRMFVTKKLIMSLRQKLIKVCTIKTVTFNFKNQ